MKTFTVGTIAMVTGALILGFSHPPIWVFAFLLMVGGQRLCEIADTPAKRGP